MNKHAILWRQLQSKKLTLIQLILCGGIIENATPKRK